MLQALRDKKREDGFTLIELMVVVLIIAILVAIAIPTFLGARERAQDKAAESDARNALTAAKTLFVDNQDFSGVTTTAMEAAEPGIEYTTTVTDAAINPGTVAIVIEDLGTGLTDNAVTIVAQSESGKFFCHADLAQPGDSGYDGGTVNSSSDTLADVDDYAGCV